MLIVELNGGIMNYIQFCKDLKKSLSEKLGNDITIEFEQMYKNNNTIKEAFLIKDPKSSSSPILYLDVLYQNYKNGKSIDGMVDSIIKRLKTEIIESEKMARIANDIEMIKDKITYRLVSRCENEMFLTNIPWIPYLDLAIIFSIHLGFKNGNQITSIITNNQLKKWNITTEEIYKLAKENTYKIYPHSIGRLDHLVLGWNDEEKIMPESYAIPTLFILTNKKGINGATCILYDSVIKEFSNKMNSDLLILPSSVHEVLLLADSGDVEYEKFENMVKEINSKDVPREDVLSDSIYLYSRKDDKIKIYQK